MKEEKKQYEAPQLTVVTFRTERGYAASSLNALLFWQLADAQQVEAYSEHDDWGSSGSFWG
ncbi:MAG: hypothetical protein IJ524_02360 [Bacteroidales bacterium]|nr:hypothetical protein [Bacteroidales bacterium]